VTPSANRALGFLLLVACSIAAGASENAVRVLVQSSPLAGYRYHAAGQVFDELRVGDELQLAREPQNPHDANAISVSWRGHKLGYVPKRENAALAWALDRGERLRARISRLAAQAAAGRRIEFEVALE
jgi:hypothetical protein